MTADELVLFLAKLIHGGERDCLFPCGRLELGWHSFEDCPEQKGLMDEARGYWPQILEALRKPTHQMLDNVVDVYPWHEARPFWEHMIEARKMEFTPPPPAS